MTQAAKILTAFILGLSLLPAQAAADHDGEAWETSAKCAVLIANKDGAGGSSDLVFSVANNSFLKTEHYNFEKGSCVIEGPFEKGKIYTGTWWKHTNHNALPGSSPSINCGDFMTIQMSGGNKNNGIRIARIGIEAEKGNDYDISEFDSFSGSDGAEGNLADCSGSTCNHLWLDKSGHGDNAKLLLKYKSGKVGDWQADCPDW